MEARMAGGLALDPGGDLPTLLRIEPRRLKMDCRQDRAGTSAPPRFFLCHREDPAAQPATPQILRQEKPFHPQDAQGGPTPQSADDVLCFGIANEDGECTGI